MIAFGGRRGPHRSGSRCRGRPIERREAGREGCLWPNAASQGRPPDGSGGESERSTQNGRAKTFGGGGGGGGGGSNSELPQAGFPESGEVLTRGRMYMANAYGDGWVFPPHTRRLMSYPSVPLTKEETYARARVSTPPTARAAAGATEDCRMHARADVGGSPRREGVVLTRTGYYLGRVDAASSGVFIYRHVRAELLKHVLVSPLGINV